MESKKHKRGGNNVSKFDTVIIKWSSETIRSGCYVTSAPAGVNALILGRALVAPFPNLPPPPSKGPGESAAALPLRAPKMPFLYLILDIWVVRVASLRPLTDNSVHLHSSAIVGIAAVACRLRGHGQIQRHTLYNRPTKSGCETGRPARRYGSTTFSKNGVTKIGVEMWRMGALKKLYRNFCRNLVFFNFVSLIYI